MNPTVTSRTIQVFSKEIPTPGGITVSARSQGYLAHHGLRTHWFAEPTNGIVADTFEMLLTSLPVLPEVALTTAFCIQVFVEGTHGEALRITRDNTRGYAVYSRETKAVMCRYFRHIAKDPGYEHIEKVDSLGGSILSSEEMTLLHFASFDRIPDDSGIYSFRKDLTQQEKNSLKSLSKRPTRVTLDDAICGDGHLNMGVIFLKKPPTPDSCGLPCTAPGGVLMYCALEPWTGSRYCKLANETCTGNDLSLVLANRAPSDEIPASAIALQANLESFRELRDTFLRRSPVGLKYIGYYRLFSRYAKLDAPMVVKYAAALPNIYKAVGAVIFGREEEIVVTPALYKKAISIIDSLSKTRNQHVKSMLADVRKDLAAARGLTRAELMEYMNHRYPME